jgi:riboflavin kinase/FMN adenylyltransferase
MPMTMKVYKSILELPKLKQTVLTIGSFDGLHHGHQKIIERVKQKAREQDLESVVVSFCPHPRLVLSPADQDFKLLSVDNEKVALFEKMGIDHLVLFPFSFEFSQQSPEEYIEQFIVKLFNPAIIIIGYDHRFGKNRAGDIYFLKKNAEKFAYTVLEIKKQEIEDITISSTRIRRAISEGDVQVAKNFSGHYYTLTGKVINGYKYGRRLGFPTANLQVTSNKLVPADGVYAVRAHLEDEVYKGMLYIGNKPTLNHGLERVIEVHIFDFNFDIYGEDLRIEFIEQIRPSQKFDSFDALKMQLKLDKDIALQMIEEASDDNQVTQSIAIVILNYNGRDYLEEFLPSVIQSTDLPVQYILADNGSTDDSISFIQEYYPEISIHELDNNYGFAEGYNRVIKSLNGIEYIVFLNSDVETEQNWLEPLIEKMEADHRIGMAQPKILSYDEKEKFEYAGAAGGYLDILAYPFCRGRIFDSTEVDDSQYDDNKEVFWCSGAAMVMRKNLFINFGGFDTDFFAHQEEIDLCWRIKKAGYKVMAIGESHVYHLGGGTLSYVNPHKNYLNFRNNLVMLLKNESFFSLLWKFPVRLVLDGVAALKFLFEGNPKSLVAILKAHGNVYRQFPNILKKRKKISQISKKYRVGSERVAGRYHGMIIWDYFIRKKSKFSDLKIND